jgi:hypothetical protein
MTRENKAGAILVMLTCPCHAVMLIFLLGGTAIGSVLAAFRAWVYLGFTLLFCSVSTSWCGDGRRRATPTSANLQRADSSGMN